MSGLPIKIKISEAPTSCFMENISGTAWLRRMGLNWSQSHYDLIRLLLQRKTVVLTAIHFLSGMAIASHRSLSAMFVTQKNCDAE